MKISAIFVFVAVLILANSAFAASQKRGGWLYEKYCISCHGEDGSGTPYGKELFFPVKDLRPNYLLTSEEIGFMIRYGLFERELLGKGETLTDRDIDDLTAYIRTFRYIPNIRAGRRLYLRLCSICHGRDGTGDKNFVTPNLKESMISDIEMTRIIRRGRHDTAMINKRRRIYNTEIADMVNYILSIREKQS